MSQMSDYLENKLIDHLFRSASFTRPALLYVALGRAAADGSFTELSGGGYARISSTPLNTNWTATQGGTSGASSGTGGATSNVGWMYFTAAVADWGADITHYAIFDAASGGNMLIYGALTNPVLVYTGEQFRIPGSYLQVTIG